MQKITFARFLDIIAVVTLPSAVLMLVAMFAYDLNVQPLPTYGLVNGYCTPVEYTMANSSFAFLFFGSAMVVGRYGFVIVPVLLGLIVHTLRARRNWIQAGKPETGWYYTLEHTPRLTQIVTCAMAFYTFVGIVATFFLWRSVYNALY